MILAGGKFVRMAGGLVFNTTGGIGCNFSGFSCVGALFVADHSGGGGSVRVAQPAKTISAPQKRMTTGLNTRQVCGRGKRTQADSGKRAIILIVIVIVNFQKRG